MFQPERMSRILVAGSKDQMDTIVRELYHQNAFHIEDFVEKEDEAYEGFRIGMPLAGRKRSVHRADQDPLRWSRCS